MASSLKALLLITSFLLLESLSNAQPSFRPRTLTLRVTKDASTGQYLTQLKQRTPLVPINVVVDLGGGFLWVDCEQGYVSSSYIPARCRSAQCSLARANGCGDCYAGPKPGCNNNTCGMFPANTVNGPATSGELAQDVLSLQSTNGSSPGPIVSVPRFLFTCGSTFLLEGLASGVKGMAGLNHAKIAMPSLLASAFSLKRKFQMCLPSADFTRGVIYFGDGIEMSKPLVYTPLLTNPISTAPVYTEGDPSYEYFIGVKSLIISNKPVPINTSLLSIDSNGYGGTKISTVNPYTVLETSIYKALTEAFYNNLKIVKTGSVSPFEFCFDSSRIPEMPSGQGPAVPLVDFVLQSTSVYWRITGANSMVQVNDKVMCLGFIDGGLNPRTSIVIGAHQLEDNLLEFDLASSRLGFSSSLLPQKIACSSISPPVGSGGESY